jgi:hypothetical protein
MLYGAVVSLCLLAALLLPLPLLLLLGSKCSIMLPRVLLIVGGHLRNAVSASLLLLLLVLLGAIQIHSLLLLLLLE